MRTKRTAAHAAHQATFKLKVLKGQKSGPVVIEGLANALVVDRGIDKIMTDAWTKQDGLANYQKNPIILFNHDPAVPVGRALSVTPSPDGLKIKVQLSESTDPLTTRIVTMVKEGIIKTFSVGFDPQDEEKNSDGVNEIKAAELFEVSLVAIPMNQDSVFSVIQKGKVRATKAALLSELDEILMRQIKGEDEPEPEGEGEEEAEEKESKQLLEGPTGESSVEGDEHRHLAQYETETGEGTAGTVIGSHEPHTHPIVDGEVMPGGSDGHTHSLDLDDLAMPEGDGVPPTDSTDKESDESDEGESDEEPGDTKQQDFQECVAQKIPVLIDEGMSREQATATAIAKCREKGVCSISDSDKDLLEKYDQLTIQGSAEAEMKEGADEAEERPPETPTVPVKTAPADDDFGDPHLETSKQILVMLGAIASKMDTLIAQGEGQSAPAEDETSEDEVEDTEADGDAELVDEKSGGKLEAVQIDRAVKAAQYIHKLGQRIDTLM